jgi:SAM-dependent methyltransferase
MGLPAPIAEIFFAEHKYKPISGDVCFIGRQTTFLTRSALDALISRYGVRVPDTFVLEFDNHPPKDQARYLEELAPGGSAQLITDRCLMSVFGDCRFNALDVSGYEGANIICDLSNDIPEELHNRFDFIYDGSCLDNIFNPAKALINFSRLLRPGGRLILAESGGWVHGPYTIFSPGWFFDFFAANKYEDCKAYVAEYRDIKGLLYGPMPVSYCNWVVNPGGSQLAKDDGTYNYNFIVAEKGLASTNDVQPVQYHYRDRNYHETVFAENVTKIIHSPRPLVSGRPWQLNTKQPLLPCGDLASGIWS